MQGIERGGERKGGNISTCPRQNKPSLHHSYPQLYSQIFMGVRLIVWCFVYAGNAPVCGPKDLCDCAFPLATRFEVTNMATQCNCPRECHQLRYSYAISNAEYSDHACKWAQSQYFQNATLNEIRRNYARLQVN